MNKKNVLACAIIGVLTNGGPVLANSNDSYIANALDSLAVGSHAKSDGFISIAIGSNAGSKGFASTSVGSGSLAVSPDSTELGSSSKADRKYDEPKLQAILAEQDDKLDKKI